MENNQEQNTNQDFKKHLDSLHEVYENSTLKEKHRLNEHIKHLIKTYGDIDTKKVEKEIDETSH